MKATTHRYANRTLLALGLGTVLSLSLSGCADPTGSANAGTAEGPSDQTTPAGVRYNTSPEQDRIRSTKDDKLAASVPAALAQDGKLTVATSAGSVPLTFHASDNATLIGTETDIAQLVADKLGLELDLQLTSWENWPLQTDSGAVEAVFSNVGINAERIKKYDFAPYRAAYMGFEATTKFEGTVKDAADVSGKKVSVGAGTNQEKILLAWNKELEAQGKEPANLQYYSSDADTILALSSGRVDLNLAPYPTTVYRENSRDDTKVVGKINAGWPSETLVAATTKHGNGLAEPISAAINELIAEGSYAKVLQRWGLEDEAVKTSKAVTAENYTSK
ncbi:transporter substrate-binding domain-containing protein [Paeniglutamicibacter sp. NPDC012692]|uniref:transporter substrate-binding domain-containing protein n=1 Tax=Paeniglutamicibacter sp. NPDC012692 TaxID=3364388 RepID=UPI0036918CF2